MQNATKSETLSNLPKRQAVASAAAAATSSSGLLGANLWDVVPIADLDTHSCEVEAFSHGHLHVSGTIVHEFFCELRKFWHYGLIVIRNLKSELTLGPLVAGEVIGDGIFARLFHHTSHLFHTVIREPHHLLILSDIIRDAVPFPSIIGAFHRVKLVFFKVLQFGFDLIRGHVRHLLAHFFSHPHLGVLLSERLLHLGSILPLEETVAGCGPIVSTAASAATATATATTTTATATATASGDDSIVVPDYRTSLAEVLSSFRGFYDGYHASGVPHLVRIGVNSFSASSVFPRIRSYLSSTPFSSYFGCGPVEQSVATVTTSSASSSVGIGGPVIGPVINPVIEPTIAPSLVAPVVTETASSSASATATATATVAETQPLLSVVEPTVVPSIIPCESTSSNAAAVATAAAAAAVAASPVVSGYQTAPLVQSVPTLSPAIVSNTVSESSSVVVAAPEIAVPAVLEGTAAAASTVTSAAASSAANVVSAPVVERVPITLPLRRYRPRPVLSTVAPAVASAAAAASASTSTGGHTLLEPSRYRGLDLDIDRRIGYSPIRSRISPAVLPSSAVTSSAAASTSVSDGSLSSAAAASSSASSVSPGGFSFVLPREQIVSALGYDYLLPGDIIAVNLKNRSTLFGRVLDASSPITFSFLRPKLRASLLRHGGRVWNLLPRDFRDPECVRKFNNPLLLRHSI